MNWSAITSPINSRKIVPQWKIVVYNLGTTVVQEPHWGISLVSKYQNCMIYSKTRDSWPSVALSGWSGAMSTNVLVTGQLWAPPVPGDHLYKIYWLPSPLEWGYRWRIVLTVSLMSPQYGTIRGLSLVRGGQWWALIGWWCQHRRAGWHHHPRDNK